MKRHITAGSTGNSMADSRVCTASGEPRATTSIDEGMNKSMIASGATSRAFEKRKCTPLTDRERMKLAQRRRSPRGPPSLHKPGLLPNLPKAQHLTTSRNDSGTLGVLGEMEDTFGVASEVGDFLDGGVVPDGDLVLRESVTAHQLLGVLAPLKSAHLGLGIHAVQTLPRRNIPKTNASIRSSTSRG